MTVVEAISLSKRFVTSRSWYGRRTAVVNAVEDVSLDLQRGETVGIVGESGAGKSTVGRLVLMLQRPDSGAVLYDGQEVGGFDKPALRSYRAAARMVFQDPFNSLNPTMRIREAVAEPMRQIVSASRTERRRRVEEALERVAIDRHLWDRRPAALSGGQLQRVAIARAIVTDPRFVVCDEPVAALDMSIRAQVINLLQDLQDERGIGYLFISHDLSLVELIAHRVIVMYRGRVVESGPTTSVLASPRHPYTARLVESVPKIASAGVPRARGAVPVAVSVDDVQHDLLGCDYAERCPRADDHCRQVTPPLQPAEDPARKHACHHPLL